MGVHSQPLGCGGAHVTNTTGYMALSWKLVVDSTNAPALADFWAAALEYEVEDPSALIKQLLAAGRIGAEAVVEHRARPRGRQGTWRALVDHAGPRRQRVLRGVGRAAACRGDVAP
jgi:hypothetical protein